MVLEVVGDLGQTVCPSDKMLKQMMTEASVHQLAVISSLLIRKVCLYLEVTCCYSLDLHFHWTILSSGRGLSLMNAVFLLVSHQVPLESQLMLIMSRLLDSFEIFLFQKYRLTLEGWQLCGEVLQILHCLQEKNHCFRIGLDRFTIFC